MLIYLVVAATTLLVIVLFRLARSTKRRRVYSGFDELIEALSAEGHEGLFTIAEDEMIPIYYAE